MSHLRARNYLLVSCFSFCAAWLQAQYTIRGKIFEADSKEPLPFVAVLIKGTTIGAQTDFDGNFVINSPKLGDSLVASYVGYRRMARAIRKNVPEQQINFPMTTGTE